MGYQGLNQVDCMQSKLLPTVLLLRPPRACLFIFLTGAVSSFLWGTHVLFPLPLKMEELEGRGREERIDGGWKLVEIGSWSSQSGLVLCYQIWNLGSRVALFVKPGALSAPCGLPGGTGCCFKLPNCHHFFQVPGGHLSSKHDFCFHLSSPEHSLELILSLREGGAQGWDLPPVNPIFMPPLFS